MTVGGENSSLVLRELVVRAAGLLRLVAERGRSDRA